MMVMQLLEGLNLDEAVSPTNAAVLTDQVVPLLEAITTDLKADRQADADWITNNLPNSAVWDSCLDPDQEYNAATDAAAAAYTALTAVANEGSHWASVSTGSGTSTSDLETDCEAFHTWFNSQTSITCEIPAGISSSSASIAAWRTAATTTKATWDTYYTNFDTKYQACLTAYTTYKTNDDDADAKQTDFESKLCFWNNHLLDMCEVHRLCVMRLTDHHNKAKAVIEAKDAVRVENGRAVNFTICLLGEIAGNVSGTIAASTALDECPLQTYPGGGSAADCTYALRSSNPVCEYSAMPFPDIDDVDGDGTTCDSAPAFVLGDIAGAGASTWMVSTGVDLGRGGNNAGVSDVKYTNLMRDRLDMNHQCTRTNASWIPTGTKFDWQ